MGDKEEAGVGRGFWLAWLKRSACRFVVGRTEGKVSVDDLRVDVGTTMKWILEKYGGRMRSGYIWLIVLDKEALSSENTDEI
jgi:hypothetical protein